MPENAEKSLNRFRDYLLVLARLQIGLRLQRQMDPSDLVQQTLLEAQAQWPAVRAQSHDQIAAWLRRILANNLADAVRTAQRAKRDVRREVSIHQGIEQSSVQLCNILPCKEPSPETRAQQTERAIALTAALAQLPEAQFDAVSLKYLRGLSLVQCAQTMGKSPAAVTGLLQRALKQLKTAMDSLSISHF